jgi:hypothetical protein
LYPTPKTESSFLKNYTPQRVIEQFECNLPSSNRYHNSGEAGREFVTRKAGFEWFFEMRSEKWTPLTQA